MKRGRGEQKRKGKEEWRGIRQRGRRFHSKQVDAEEKKKKKKEEEKI